MREPRTTQQKLQRIMARVQMTIALKCVVAPADAMEELDRLMKRLERWTDRIQHGDVKHFFICLSCMVSIAASQAEQHRDYGQKHFTHVVGYDLYEIYKKGAIKFINCAA